MITLEILKHDNLIISLDIIEVLDYYTETVNINSNNCEKISNNIIDIICSFGYYVIDNYESDRSSSLYFRFCNNDEFNAEEVTLIIGLRVADHELNLWNEDNGYSDIDVNNTYDAMFVPYTDIDNVEEFDAGFGIGMEYPYQAPIKTGYFLTYRKHDLKNRFTDIFNILNRKHLIILDHKYPKSNERLYPEFGLSNNDLYNNLLINCNNYIDGRVSFIMVDTIEEQIEMLRNLIPVIDRDKMLWRDISLSELDNLEKQLLQRQKELEQK